MKLCFDAGEEAGFLRTRDELLDRFVDYWGSDEGMRRDVEMALDWKWRYGDGDLGRWTEDDAARFLFEYCPAKVAMPPEEARSLPISLARFIAFLADERLLSPGSAPAPQLYTALCDAGDGVVAAMGDRSRFSPTKAMLAGMADLGYEVDLSDQASLDRLIAQFNALPFEMRDQLLGGPGTPRDPWSEFIGDLELPPAPRLPADVVAELAGAAPVVSHIRAIREFLGGGRKLTAKGNLTVADAKAIGDLVGEANLQLFAKHGWSIRSADRLPKVQFLVRWARAAGALRVANGRILATASWAKLPAAAQLTKAVTTLLDHGPLELRARGAIWKPEALMQVLDGGVVHVLAVLWAVPGGVEFEELLELVTDVCEASISFDSRFDPASDIRREVDVLIDTLEVVGVAARDGAERQENEFGFEKLAGGMVSLTPLGRAVLGPILTESGYEIPDIGELADRPLEAIFPTIGTAWTHERVCVEFDDWVERHSAAEAIDQMTALLDHYPDPQWPLAAIDLASRLQPADEEQALQRFLGTQAQGHAINRLIELGRPVDIDHDAVLRASVEFLSLHADGHDDEDFIDLVSGIDDLSTFIEDVWRMRIPASVIVLEGIGRLHPDKQLAKAARKAAFKHRSLTANGTR